jgi:hypothetical protein
MNREGPGVRYISADEFDAIKGKSGGRGWVSKYQSVLRGLKDGGVVVLPCLPGCWLRPTQSCSAMGQASLLLGSGNYQSKHLVKRGTPNNHIAVKKLRQEER